MNFLTKFVVVFALASASLTSQLLAGEQHLVEHTVTLDLVQRERVVIEATVTGIDRAPSTTGNVAVLVKINGNDASRSHDVLVTRTKEGTARLQAVLLLERGTHKIELYADTSQEADATAASLEVRVLDTLR